MISFSFKILLLLNVGIHCYVDDGAKEIVRAGYKATLLCSVRDNLKFQAQVPISIPKSWLSPTNSKRTGADTKIL